MALKMLSLQLSNQASCFSCHAIEDVAAADAEASAPSHPIVADVIAVYVEPRVLPPPSCCCCCCCCTSLQHLITMLLLLLSYHHGAENAAPAAVEPSLLPLMPCH